MFEREKTKDVYTIVHGQMMHLFICKSRPSTESTNIQGGYFIFIFFFGLMMMVMWVSVRFPGEIFCGEKSFRNFDNFIERLLGKCFAKKTGQLFITLLVPGVSKKKSTPL